MEREKPVKEEKKSPQALHDEIKSNSKKDRRRRLFANALIVFCLIVLAVLAKVYIFKGDIKISNQQGKNPSEKIESRPEVEATTTTGASTTTTGASVATTTTAPQQGFTPYVVKEGDTYSSIANSNGMTSKQLMDYNGATDPASLKVGDQIKIPK